MQFPLIADCSFFIADLNIFLILNGIIFCTICVKFYTQKVNNSTEIEDETCRMYVFDFPVSAITVVCTVHTTFVNIVHMTILH